MSEGKTATTEPLRSESEIDLQRWLDEHPTDHHAREILGEWLEDLGDERGRGYRALGRLQRTSVFNKNTGIFLWSTWTDYEKESDFSQIDHEWINLIPGVKPAIGGRPRSDRVTHHPSRILADDAAALAFVRLPPGEQQRILGEHEL